MLAPKFQVMLRVGVAPEAFLLREDKRPEATPTSQTVPPPAERLNREAVGQPMLPASGLSPSPRHRLQPHWPNVQPIPMDGQKCRAERSLSQMLKLLPVWTWSSRSRTNTSCMV